MGRKLIEDALPFFVMNTKDANSMTVRPGAPSTLHRWWTRKPTPIIRAVIFASLVDSPYAHEEIFPTERSRRDEKERLFRIIERLVADNGLDDRDFFAEVRREITKWNGEEKITLLDPFAGGGTIPLEAKRLGLVAAAGDVNPVAVLINKAMFEIPQLFGDMPPVHTGANETTKKNWRGAEGLAADILHYGKILTERAEEKLAALYPKVAMEGTREKAMPIAWLWARTVVCQNPACRLRVPLVKSFCISKRNGSAYIKPIADKNGVRYEVRAGLDVPKGTVDGAKATCPFCGRTMTLDYIRNEGRQHRLTAEMMAVVAARRRGRIYLAADDEQKKAALLPATIDAALDAPLPASPKAAALPCYGISSFADIFTARQHIMLTTFRNLLPEIGALVKKDAKNFLADDRKKLSGGGRGSRAYAEAITVYLAFLVDKLADYNSALCSWHNKKSLLRNTFTRPKLSMVWDFAEANPFSGSTGCVANMLEWMAEAVRCVPTGEDAVSFLHDAAKSTPTKDALVLTDVPLRLTDYGDLSDFFYVWLKTPLKKIYPELFATELTDKENEIVANPYRLNFEENVRQLAQKKRQTDISIQANAFYEERLKLAFQNMYDCAADELPVVVFTPNEWELTIEAAHAAAFVITAIWPLKSTAQSENSRSRAQRTALFVMRKRDDCLSSLLDEFTDALQKEKTLLPQKITEAQIPPDGVSAFVLGRGVTIYSRLSPIREICGLETNVRTALKIIEKEFAEYLGGND